MSKNPSAGQGDPYWYEWSTGQRYVIEMLEPSHQIETVTLQSSGTKGLDDVVVRYASGDSLFIQVKHTRAGDTITFGDLVRGEEGGTSTLRSLARAWKAERELVAGECKVVLSTNRALGATSSTTRGARDLVRPPLTDLIAALDQQLSRVADLKEIQLPNDWQLA